MEPSKEPFLRRAANNLLTLIQIIIALFVIFCLIIASIIIGMFFNEVSPQFAELNLSISPDLLVILLNIFGFAFILTLALAAIWLIFTLIIFNIEKFLSILFVYKRSNYQRLLRELELFDQNKNRLESRINEVQTAVVRMTHYVRRLHQTIKSAINDLWNEVSSLIGVLKSQIMDHTPEMLGILQAIATSHFTQIALDKTEWAPLMNFLSSVSAILIAIVAIQLKKPQFSFSTNILIIAFGGITIFITALLSGTIWGAIYSTISAGISIYLVLKTLQERKRGRKPGAYILNETEQQREQRRPVI